MILHEFRMILDQTGNHAMRPAQKIAIPLLSGSLAATALAEIYQLDAT